jgi:AcrR family transcriptional regulator
MTTAKTRRRPGRERVLATADRLFYSEGVRAVGVDRISAEADVSKATLYANFGTKEGLVVAYLEGRSRAWQVYLNAELDRRGGSPRDRILMIFDLLGESFDSTYEGCPFIKAESECGGEPAVHAVAVAHRKWIRRTFQVLVNESGLPSAAELAKQLTMLYDGALIGAQSESRVGWAVAAKAAAAALLGDRP